MAAERRDPVVQDEARDEARPATQPYTPPQLVVHGTIEDLTQGIIPPGVDIAALGSPIPGG